MPADQLQNLCLFFFASNEGGQGGGQVVRSDCLPWFRQFAQACLPGKFQQALYRLGIMLKMQGGHKKSLERPRIGHTMTLFEPADLRIAVSHHNGELALGEFFPFAQIFEEVAKGGKCLW